MKYDLSKWLSNMSAIHHALASDTRIMLADAKDSGMLTDAEIATLEQWIANAEHVRDEAYAILINWTELPRSKNDGDA